MSTNLDYGEIEEVLGRILEREVSFENLVQEMMDSGRIVSLTDWFRLIGNVVLEQFVQKRQMLGYFMILILLAAILTTAAKAFRNKQISDMGFYMIFLLLFVLMMKNFAVCCGLTEGLIMDLVDFMKVLMPAYLMAAAVGSYSAAATVYYEGFFLLVYYLQKLVEIFLMPAIRCYAVFAMLNYLSREKWFSRGLEGLKRLITWSLKAMVGVSAGFHMIQGMLAPAVDEMKHSVISKGVSSLGNVGQVAQNVTDVVLSSSALLKNGIGALGAVFLVSISLIPVAEIACYVVFYQVLAAVAEPISDKRITEILSQMGDGMGLLVKLSFTVSALFLLVIAVVCVTTGGMG